MCQIMIFMYILCTIVIAKANDLGTSKQVDENSKTITKRTSNREFPSIFQAWNPADNLSGEDRLVTLARHDLVFHSPEFYGLRWDQEFIGLATSFTPKSITSALAMRNKLLKLNPNIILLAEIRYHDAYKRFLPEKHKWWQYKDGKPIVGWEEGGYFLLNFQDTEFREHVAEQCKAVIDTGVVDGIMLDWWVDDKDRLELVKAIRKTIGEEGLILANANDQKTPLTAPYLNGYFMECYRSESVDDWKLISDTLLWAEKNLRYPRINCLETWYHNSRQDLNLMRATTTLCLTHSNGYCLFSDPNPLPTPDHLHDWYPFWNKSLGKSIADGKTREDSTTIREFEKGTVVYNPMGGNTATLIFPEARTSVATGKCSRKHSLNPADGDIYLKSVK